MLNVKHDFTVHPKAAAPGVRAIGHTLDDVYGSYSAAKAKAYRYCMDLCNRYDGYYFCITWAIDPDDFESLIGCDIDTTISDYKARLIG